MRSNNRKRTVKTPKGILMVKGNFTQKQFDALGQIWDNLQHGAHPNGSLPAIQMSNEGSLTFIRFDADGHISALSVGPDGRVSVGSTREVK